MDRDQFWTVLEAVALALPDESEVILIGSQAAWGWTDQLPASAMRSREVDVAPLDDADNQKADRVNWVVGELSAFDDEHDVYAEGVSIDLFIGPDGWLGRSRRLEVPRPSGDPLVVVCPEVHDLCVGKLMAGRLQDEAFTAALIGEGLVDPDRIAFLFDGTHGSTGQLAWARDALARARPS